jgi:lysophospholipase L1-like esterase
VGGRGYGGYNAVLARLDARRRNLVVVEWTRVAARHREWFGEDGVHPNGTGYEVRARAIARAVRRCRRIVSSVTV